MKLREFIKKEPILLKILYVLGVIFLLISLNELTTGNDSLNYVYTILAFTGILLFFIRMGIYVNKSEKD